MNKFWKKLLATGLVVLMMATMGAVGCYASGPSSGINLGATQNILSEYQQEIDLVEAKCGHPIDEITPETRKEIASVANRYLYNSTYRFSELMTDIAIASASSNSGSAQTQSTTSAEIWRAYGPITGEFIASLPAGSSATLSDSFDLTLSVDVIPGINISGGRTVTISYSFSGPAQGATLFNGMRATHNYACGIMFGTIMKDGDRFYIEDKNGDAFVSYAAVTARGTLYVDAGAYDFDSSGYWVSLNAFKEYLVTHPQFYLRGNS